METNQAGVVRSDRYKKNVESSSSSFVTNIGRFKQQTRTNSIDNLANDYKPKVNSDDTSTDTSNQTTKATKNVVDAQKKTLNGVDAETKKEMAEVSELIDNMIAKFKDMSESNDAPEIKQKLTFWQHAKAMEVKIKGRLEEYGIADDAKLKQDFKNLYTRRAFMLTNKAKQGPYADNAPKFYGDYSETNSTLTQIATGASQEKLDANSALTKKYADSIEIQKEKIDEHTKAIKEAQKAHKEAQTQEARDEIKKELAQLHEKRNTETAIHQALYTGGLRFGGRATSFNDSQRAQYEAFQRDAIALKGDVSTALLP
jgi:hypothetical protein